MDADQWAVLVAATALAISLWQWMEARHQARLRLLLGEKETVAHVALSLARTSSRWVRRSTIRALVAAALFEKSDRAQLMVYEAIDGLRSRHEVRARQVFAEFTNARAKYGDAVDPASYDQRVAGLVKAVPWLEEPTESTSLDRGA